MSNKTSYELQGYVTEESLWDWIIGKRESPYVDFIELPNG